MKRWLLLSLLFHAVAVAVFCLTIGSQAFESQPTNQVQLRILKVNIGPGTSSAFVKVKPHRYHAMNFSVPWPPVSNIQQASDHLKKTATKRAVDGYQIANEMTSAEEDSLYPFLESVWRRVNATLTYPHDFVEQEIQGGVTVQLAVDERGVFTGEIRSVHGVDPMLNTFAMAALIHALSRPLAKRVWIHQRAILLVFHFRFHLIGPGEQQLAVSTRHFKNILFFRPQAWYDPEINRKINKFYTRYVPPIIPLPGGFYIDFIHAYAFMQYWTHPKIDSAVLRKMHLKSQKELLDHFIERRVDRRRS